MGSGLEKKEVWVCVNQNHVMTTDEPKLIEAIDIFHNSPKQTGQFAQEFYSNLKLSNLLKSFPEDTMENFPLNLSYIDWVSFFICKKDDEHQNDRIVTKVVGFLYFSGMVIASDTHSPKPPIRFCTDTKLLTQCKVFDYFPIENIIAVAHNLFTSGRLSKNLFATARGGVRCEYYYDEEERRWKVKKIDR